MPRYFSDLDDGKTKYVDKIGTELSDVKMASREAIEFLASVFKDALPDTSDSIFVVSVRNEAGQTIFTTTLMLQSDWLDTRHDATANKRPVVLVVDDDLLSRVNAADMIVDAGYEVMEVGSADEAIAILETRSDIEIVFADTETPGSEDGLKLASYVDGRCPQIKIIAASEYFAICESNLPNGGYAAEKVHRL
jgi:PleD family two-component response regulator